MTRKRIYIAGPVSGRPHLNQPAFAAAAAALRGAGHEPVNPHGIAPHAHDGNCPPSYAVNAGHSAACYLRTCFAALLACDELYLLEGWPDSLGATREYTVARWAGIPVHGDQEAHP